MSEHIQEENQNTEIEGLQEIEEQFFDTLIIKGKFKFQSAGIYGIFAIILRTDIDFGIYYDLKLNPFISLHILTSYFSDIFHINLKEPWASLEKTFNEIQIKGSYANSITETFQKGTNGVFNENGETSFRLVTDFKENKLSQIHNELDNILSQIYKDRQLHLEISFEEVNGQDIASIKEFRIKNEIPEPNENVLNTPAINIDPLNFSIPARPILAPIGEGVPSNQLSKGVRILMKIDSNSSYGQQWINIFKAFDKEHKKVIPLIGTVEQIGPIIKNNLDILVKYQDDQYTKFNIESGIKIKLFQPHGQELVIDPLSQDHYERKTNNSSNKGLQQLFQEQGFKNMAIAGIGLLIISLIALYFIILF
ncbi:MAG: hypothetical protein ACRC0X_09155 [Brevinema sp.]